MTFQRGLNGWARKSRRSLCLSSGLDLQLPIVCADFRTLALASLQILGHEDARLIKLARSSINPRMVKHVSEKRFYIFNMIILRLRWVNWTLYGDDSMICMCQSDTAIKLRACKRTGHIGTFQRYFDSLR